MTYAACKGWENLTLSPDLGLHTAGHYMPVVPQGQKTQKETKTSKKHTQPDLKKKL